MLPATRLFLLFSLNVADGAFISSHVLTAPNGIAVLGTPSFVGYCSRDFGTPTLRATDAFQDDMGDDEEEEEEVEPGKMKVSELKAELDLRGVGYSDCFDKESLAARLLEARATGKADPTIIDEFNKSKLDDIKGGLSDEEMQKVVGGDGTLPGGMPPDMLKKLMSNPELMTLLQAPKMQEAMKLMMTGGQAALEKAMAEDKEIYETVTKLNQVMADVQ